MASLLSPCLSFRLASCQPLHNLHPKTTCYPSLALSICPTALVVPFHRLPSCTLFDWFHCLLSIRLLSVCLLYLYACLLYILLTIRFIFATFNDIALDVAAANVHKVNFQIL
jgi:hypothetical protein